MASAIKATEPRNVRAFGRSKSVLALRNYKIKESAISDERRRLGGANREHAPGREEARNGLSLLSGVACCDDKARKRERERSERKNGRERGGGRARARPPNNGCVVLTSRIRDVYDAGHFAYLTSSHYTGLPVVDTSYISGGATPPMPSFARVNRREAP